MIKQQTGSFYLFISPWLIGFLLFTLGPMIYSIYISLTSWNLMSAPQWVGLKNYVHAAQDPRLGQALDVTFSLCAGYRAAERDSLVPRLATDERQAARHLFFRTFFYLPLLVSGVAQAVLFSRLFNPNTGVINTFLRLFGIARPALVARPELVAGRHRDHELCGRSAET